MVDSVVQELINITYYNYGHTILKSCDHNCKEEEEKDSLYKALKDAGITVGEFQNILELHANAEVKK